MIKYNSKKVKERFKKIQDWAGEHAPNFLEKLAQRVRVSIKDRVQSKGQGIKKKLKKYSPKYKKYKKEKGRKVSFRDLTFSGRMWNALDIKKLKNQTVIFFKGKEEQEKAKGNQKRTAFFGLGKPEKRIIKDAMKELIKKAL